MINTIKSLTYEEGQKLIGKFCIFNNIENPNINNPNYICLPHKIDKDCIIFCEYYNSYNKEPFKTDKQSFTRWGELNKNVFFTRFATAEEIKKHFNILFFKNEHNI